jgi:hypothetical protein
MGAGFFGKTVIIICKEIEVANLPVILQIQYPGQEIRFLVGV